MIKKFLAKRKAKKRFERNYKIIKESGLFDVDYYLENYPDVKVVGIDPIKHYLMHGWREGRNPNDYFDTFYYLKRYADVSQSSINPLVHYILHGKREDREIFLIECKEDRPENLFVDYQEHSPIKSDLKLIAFYLPQFHPFPENDEWWGKGFTEWTNVTKATPNFEGHYQPHLPIHNGFYDLRVPEVMIEQAKLARNYGIYGFNFYYYWFNGKILMHKPFEILLEHKEIDINFCITWANESWTRKWNGLENDILIKQEYSEENTVAFIHGLFKYFRDERYIKINGKPVLMVYKPNDIPNVKEICELWRKEAKKSGFDDLYLICSIVFPEPFNPLEIGFDAGYEFPPLTTYNQFYSNEDIKINSDFSGNIYDYKKVVDSYMLHRHTCDRIYRTVMLSWDNTARRQNDSSIFHNFTLQSYSKWLSYACEHTINNKNFSNKEKIVFINAWNEWAEGTHLEPDAKYGYGYLESTYNVFKACENDKKIIFVSHDARPHGAQYLSLNLVKTLVEDFHYSVLIILNGVGSLIDDFMKFGKVCFAHELSKDNKNKLFKEAYDDGYQIAIANTSVVGDIIESMSNNNIYTISLIHEMKNTIKLMGLEESIKKINQYAKTIIFPSQIVKDDFQTFEKLKNNVLIQPQGLYKKNKYRFDKKTARELLFKELNKADNKLKIILGAGYGDRRKGIDLFVETACKLIKKDSSYCFVWIGNYDENFYKQITNNINKKFLKNIFFLGIKKDIDIYFAGSDVFFLSSREDPFPSVVLEAMDVGLPVIAFKNAGGFSDIIGCNTGALVDYENTEKAAREIENLFKDREKLKLISTYSMNLIDEKFNWKDYAYFLLDILNEKFQKISVIVPCYNHEKFIQERFESIFNQNYPIYEVIFLDDCSHDDSVKIAKNIFQKSSVDYKIYINDKNSGSPFKQWKKGIELAKGAIIWIAEGDDSCSTNFLKILAPYFNDPTVNIAFSKFEKMDEHGNINEKYFYDYFMSLGLHKLKNSYIRNGNEEINENLGYVNTLINASGILIRKNSFGDNLASASDYKICGDWLIYLECLKNGKIVYDPNAIDYFRRHKNSTVSLYEGNIKYFKELEGVYKYVLNNFSVSKKIRKRMIENLEKEKARFGEKILSSIYDRNHIEKYCNKDIPNLLVVASDFSLGGGQIFSIRLANAWEKLGGKVVILNVDKHPKISKIIDKISKTIPLYDVNKVDLTSVIEKYDIDIIHSSIWWADRYVYENIKSLVIKPKWVVTMHGCYESLLKNPHWDGDFEKYFLDMLNYVDHWVYTAEKNKDIFTKYLYPKKLVKIFNGYEGDVDNIKQVDNLINFHQNSFIVCLASRAIETKGWYETANAIVNLNKQNYKIDLLLIGDGEILDDMKKKYWKCEYIHFINTVSNLHDYIALADVGILPTTFIGESMPLSLIEFMAQGKPIISSDIGEIKEMLSDEFGSAGVILNINENGKIEVKDIEEAILKLFLDKKFKKECEANSKRLFEKKFTMKKMISSYMEIYKSDYHR